MNISQDTKLTRSIGAMGIWSSLIGVLVLILPMFFMLQGGFSPDAAVRAPSTELAIAVVQPDNTGTDIAVVIPQSLPLNTQTKAVVPPSIDRNQALAFNVIPLKPREVKARPIPDAKVGFGTGNFAPDFTMKTRRTENVTLSEYRGKFVMLNFWATDCGACIVEFPVIRALWNKYEKNTRDVMVFTICLNAASDDVKRIEEKYGEKYGPLDFPILLDEAHRAGKDYGIMLTPLAFFIDTDGIIRHIKPGRFQSIDEIDLILRTLD